MAGTVMRVRTLATGVALALSGCVAGEYNAPRMEWADTNLRTPYAFTTSTEVARVGETSQRFELRHGNCVGYDCNNDRQRFELMETSSSENAVGDTVWYGYAIYLPSDFEQISPANTTVGQVKLVRWRGPLWNFNILRDGLVFEYRPNGQHHSVVCRVANLSQIRGRWTDLVVYSNLSTTNTTGSPMIQAWANGRPVCSSNQPLVTTSMVSEANSESIYFKYGIYNSYVSRWLNENRTRSVISTVFADYHTDSGGTNNSVAARPFDIDWGVELPTQVVYYDEVRIGRTREDVDVRLRYPN